MSVVFRVYCGSYEGEWTLRVFADEDEAVAYARAEARTTNEEFTGSTGYGVGIERLDSDSGTSERLQGWHDWKTTFRGAHFVLAEESNQDSAPKEDA